MLLSCIVVASTDDEPGGVGYFQTKNKKPKNRLGWGRDDAFGSCFLVYFLCRYTIQRSEAAPTTGKYELSHLPTPSALAHSRSISKHIVSVGVCVFLCLL